MYKYFRSQTCVKKKPPREIRYREKDSICLLLSFSFKNCLLFIILHKVLRGVCKTVSHFTFLYGFIIKPRLDRSEPASANILCGSSGIQIQRRESIETQINFLCHSCVLTLGSVLPVRCYFPACRPSFKRRPTDWTLRQHPLTGSGWCIASPEDLGRYNTFIDLLTVNQCSSITGSKFAPFPTLSRKEAR